MAIKNITNCCFINYQLKNLNANKNCCQKYWYKVEQRKLIHTCNPMAHCQTSFCGEKLPMAADNEGKTL